MKRIIYAMSKSKQDVGADIEQGTRELILHLIKLWAYPNSRDKNKWRKEVAEKLNYVDSFKGSHKYPSSKFILDNSWVVHRSRLSYYVSIIEDDYGEFETDDSYYHLRTNIDEYFSWLAGILSQYGQVSYKQIYVELDTLGF